MADIRLPFVMNSSMFLQRTNLSKALSSFIAMKLVIVRDVPLEGPYILLMFPEVIIPILLFCKFEVSTIFKALEKHFY